MIVRYLVDRKREFARAKRGRCRSQVSHVLGNHNVITPGMRLNTSRAVGEGSQTLLERYNCLLHDGHGKRWIAWSWSVHVSVRQMVGWQLSSSILDPEPAGLGAQILSTLLCNLIFSCSFWHQMPCCEVGSLASTKARL